MLLIKCIMFVKVALVIAGDENIIGFKFHPFSRHKCKNVKSKYKFHIKERVDIHVYSQKQLYYGWCKINNDHRFETQSLEYITNQHEGVFQDYTVDEAVEGEFKCCLLYNREVLKNALLSDTVTYNNVGYSQKCCHTYVVFTDEIIVNFEIQNINTCDIKINQNDYYLKKNQDLIVVTTSKVGAAAVLCQTENNRTINVHSTNDYKAIGEGSNLQQPVTARQKVSIDSADNGLWNCTFDVGGQPHKTCNVRVNIIKEKSDDDSSSMSKMTITYIAVGVSLAVLLIIAQTWAIFYFRNKAKAAARLERLSTGKNDDQKKEKRVYIDTPPLSSLLKAKQDDRVESEIYESIDPIELDPGLRPPVPLPTEADEVYEDPETVKDVFSRGVFLPAKSSNVLKPQPPPCSTLPNRKKEKPAEKKEVPQNRPPMPVPVAGLTPLQPPLKPVTKPTSVKVANELDNVFKRRNKASSPAAPAIRLPPKPTTLPHSPKPTTLPHHPKPVPELAPKPAILAQKPVKPAVQAVKQVVDNRNTPMVNHPAKRPLPQPTQNPNFVKSPPRPPKPITMQTEPDQEELSDFSDHEFDEYDVLPQFNIYNR